MREEIIGDCRLILGDCLEVMQTLGNVDAVITDPPFCVGFKYDIHDDRPEAYIGGYGTWLMTRISIAENICSDGSPIFIWQSNKNNKFFPTWFERDYRIYISAKNFVQMRPTPMQWSYDPIVVWWKGEKNPYALGNASRDFFICNTAPIIASTDNIERQHPCPRPLDQVELIVEQWVKPNGMVIDPFMGSGTTGVACVKLGRRFIGIEISEKYFEIACRRIEQAYKQPDFFIDPPKKAVQEELL
jgi:site-specific DNA-methyltransferase (adenine-specific)